MTIPHGITGYERHGCRCEVCRDANAARVRRNRARRRELARLAHGTRSAYDAGCRCQPCADTRMIAYMEGEGGYRNHDWRELVTGVFRDAETARDAIRESSMPMSQVPGGAHSSVAAYQLSDAEFAALVPTVTFKQILKDFRGQGEGHHEDDQ